MSGILVYSNNPNLSRELQTAGLEIANGAEIYTLAIEDGAHGEGIQGKHVVVVKQAASISDVAATAATIASVVERLGITTLLLGSDRRGKEIAGRLAQKLGCGVLTDVSALDNSDGKLIGSRNALGGAVMEQAEIVSEEKIFAIAPRSYEQNADGEESRVSIDVGCNDSSITVSSAEKRVHSGADVTAAETLFVCGLGVENREDVDKVESLAARLGGAVGCTKPTATDKKWFTEDRIIGISGKTCKPSLAVLLGVSGQVQFWAGIRDAKVIAAVNSDENAAIMSMVDYSLVGSAEDVIPQLASML